MCGIPRIGRPLNAFSTSTPVAVRLVRCLFFVFLRGSRSCGRCLPATSLRGGGWPRANRAQHTRNSLLSGNRGATPGFSRPRFCAQGPPRRKPSGSRPELRLGYPLNLSILVSGGKETKRDELSNGERRAQSPYRESGLLVLTCGVQSRFQRPRRCKSLGNGHDRG